MQQTKTQNEFSIKNLFQKLGDPSQKERRRYDSDEDERNTLVIEEEEPHSDEPENERANDQKVNTVCSSVCFFGVHLYVCVLNMSL